MTAGDRLVEDAFKGATKAVIEEAPDLVEGFVNKFLNKEIAFIRDPKEITEIVEKKKLPEYATFAKFVNDPYLRLEFQMGLRLRELEKKSETDKIRILRTKLLESRDHGKRGLHVAEFVWNGLFPILYANLMQKSLTNDNLSFELNSFFKSIEQFTSFIQAKDKIAIKVREIITKIDTSNPDLFIILGIAMKSKAEEIKTNVMKNIADYTCDKYPSELANREIFLISHKAA